MLTAGMNAESFIEYLAQPAKLYQLPYQEIKNLVAEYPYSANLRLLLAIKSKLEQDANFEQHLHRLAAHTFDRERLFQLIHQELPALVGLETAPEERLELKDLNELNLEDKVTIAADYHAAPQEEALGMNVEIPIATPIPQSMPTTIDDDDDEITLDLEKVDISIPVATAQPKPYRITVALLKTLVSGAALVPSAPKPRPKTSFESWGALQQKEDKRRWKRLSQQALSQKGDSPSTHKTTQFAARSVEDTPALASETLAKILVRQEQYAKAIKIYERLILLYPKKSRYFAATIENLKQKL